MKCVSVFCIHGYDLSHLLDKRYALKFMRLLKLSILSKIGSSLVLAHRYLTKRVNLAKISRQTNKKM